MAKPIIGLTLSGGGARGAYQAGVLRAINDICRFKTSPFQVISGVSAGSINAMALASGAQDFDRASRFIWDTWLDLEIKKIFKSNLGNLLKISVSWVAGRSLGGLTQSTRATHLLDTSPLHELLSKKIDMSLIGKNFASGLLHAVSLSATDYRSGKGVTFYDGDSRIKDWDRHSGMGKRSVLTIDHIMASTALPIFFPPVRIDDADYGDGGIGLSAPLSPAIRLGADRILIIGLEHSRGKKEVIKSSEPVALGDIVGTLLNAIFLKSMRSDLIRLEQTNTLLTYLSPKDIVAGHIDLRPVPTLFIQPSVDLGQIGMNQLSQFPATIRHLLKGLGLTDSRAWDLLSYLAFEKNYAQALLDLGYQDGLSKEREILAFFPSTSV